MRNYSSRLKGLTPDSPPAVEEQEGVIMELPTFVDAPIETTSSTKSR